jgi:hypothetical protein
MDVGRVIQILAISAGDQVFLYETAEELWQDIGRSPEHVARLQNDVFAFRFNLYLQGICLRRIGTLEYMDASYDDIALMIAGLRGKGESLLTFNLGVLPGVDLRGPRDDLDAALNAVGWRALSEDEQRVLYKAPNLVRCRNGSKAVMRR